MFASFTKIFTGNPNEASRLGPVQGIVEHGTFSIDNSQFNSTIDRVLIKGHYYSDKPAPAYLIFVPTYYLLYNLDISFEKNIALTSYLISLSVVGLLSSIMLVYFYRMLVRYHLSSWKRLFLTAGLGLGTLIFPYSLIINGHSVAAALIFISFYLMVNAVKPCGYVLAGLVGGYAASVDPVAGPLFLLAFAILVFVKTRFQMTKWYVLGAAVPILIYLFINLSISGSIMPFQFVPEYFKYPGSAISGGPGSYYPGTVSKSFLQFLDYAWATSLGKKGLFVYSPLLLFSVVGLALASFRRNKYNKEAISVFAAALLTFIFIALKTDNYGGCNFGFRLLVPIIPVIFFFTPFLFEQKEFTRVLKWLFVMAFVVSVAIALLGVIQHPWTCSPGMMPEWNLSELLGKLYQVVAFHHIS